MRATTEPGRCSGNVLPFGGAVEERSVARRLKRIMAARRARKHFFPATVLTEQSWEMLLEAYLAVLEQRRIFISALCDAADVPPTTGLRWVNKLEEEQFVLRKPDPLDGRRVWIELSPRGTSAMTRYFEAIADALPL